MNIISKTITDSIYALECISNKFDIVVQMHNEMRIYPGGNYNIMVPICIEKQANEVLIVTTITTLPLIFEIRPVNQNACSVSGGEYYYLRIISISTAPVLIPAGLKIVTICSIELKQISIDSVLETHSIPEQNQKINTENKSAHSTDNTLKLTAPAQTQLKKKGK